jgi:CDP-glucose 4,6-dehydratase
MGVNAFYRGRRVFLTGHTGFKGAWLSLWLRRLDAEVTGYALPPEDARGNLFKLAGLSGLMDSVEGDVCDVEALKAAMARSKAELVFHLAAQPLVLKSYADPFETYRSNALGTVGVLEAARHSPSVRAVVVVTTDKCYENREWPWPYREDDALGGRDPYSSSKAMAELAVSAFRRSFFAEKGVGLASARAGNVIGGGDYAADRILPDIVEAIAQGRPAVLRNPLAVRPWQHVLDALHGYLLLGARLAEEPAAYGEAFNFSPGDTGPEHTVRRVAETFVRAFGRGTIEVDPSTRRGHEASYLSLDSSKARRRLGWRQILPTDEAIAMSAAWYRDVAADPSSARERTLADIAAFRDRSAHA